RVIVAPRIGAPWVFNRLVVDPLARRCCLWSDVLHGAQDADRVLAVIPGDCDELVEDPLLVNWRCRSIALADGRDDLASRLRTDLGHGASAACGNKLGEATVPPGSRSGEAMRRQESLASINRARTCGPGLLLGRVADAVLAANRGQRRVRQRHDAAHRQ